MLILIQNPSVDSDSFNDMDNKENSSCYLNVKNKNNSRI